MYITTLKAEHLKAAAELALMNYQEERAMVQALPEITGLPDLSWFLENQLGVAALEGEELIGFICCYNPWDGAFDSTAKGTFTPIHAHGCIKENRAKIYEMMYQELAEKLVAKQVLYHGIALYEHDSEAIKAYFHNGFGHRCVDAIRRIAEVPEILPEGIVCEEIPAEEAILIRPLRRELKNHMGESCCFMYSSEEEFERWVLEREKNGSRIFVARKGADIIAFLEVADEGETFLTERTDMKNICGAYCLPQYRGQQIMQGLIAYVNNVLYREGYQYLGVDYESFNPTAYHFWPKLFKPYTCSVVRRIDEGILRK